MRVMGARMVRQRTTLIEGYLLGLGGWIEAEKTNVLLCMMLCYVFPAV